MPQTITFQPSPKMDEFINTLVSTGDYGSQSEVIREAIRLLQEKQAKSKLTQLRKLINDEGSADNTATTKVQTAPPRNCLAVSVGKTLLS